MAIDTKAPRIRAVAGRLAERARDEGWDYQAYLAAVLAEEVSARDSHGGASGKRAALTRASWAHQARARDDILGLSQEVELGEVGDELPAGLTFGR